MMLRLIFTGRLVATGPVLPGAGRGEGACDLPVRRDAAGRALIPGTALAGVLRSLATRLAPAIGHRACDALTTPAAHSKPCRCPVCKLFGEIQPDEDNRDGGEASRLLCAHAMAKLPAGATVGFRDGVGIRRGTGASAAASAAKYDYEVLPEDTSFALRIEYQTPAEGEVAEQMQLLAACLAEWAAGRVWIGAAAARGLGALRLEELTVRRLDLREPAPLMDYLRADDTWHQGERIEGWLAQQVNALRAKTVMAPVPTSTLATLQGFAEIVLTLRLPPPFLVNDPQQSTLSGYDHAPLLHRDARGDRLVLPGASLRGVLRAQCERIARTLATAVSADAADFGRRCPACDPHCRPLDSDGRSPADTPLASCSAIAEHWIRYHPNPTMADRQLQQGQLCPTCQLFGSTRFGSRLRVVGGSVALPREAAARNRDFLAIDRFTGGARAHAKFDAQVPTDEALMPVRLFLETPTAAELGWLYLALRDLDEGLIRVGFGAAKGFGRAQIAAGRLRLGCLGEAEGLGLPMDVAPSTDDPGLFDLREWPWQDACALAAEHWVDAFCRALDTFRRDDAFVLGHDSWLGVPIHGLDGETELTLPDLYGPARITP